MSLSNTVSSVTSIIRGLVKDQTKTDGQDLFIYTGDSTFPLSEMYPSSSSIRVLKNDVEISSADFSYDSDTNRVEIDFITSGESLSTNDQIIILYSYYKKYSDSEIKGYLTSALSYFAQHQYKKIFEINSSDEIVSINGTNPNSNELYFIAIIASILIDPQNIRIDTADFKISANRELSDQQQIAEAFARFKRFVGRIDFVEIDLDI